MRKGKEYVEVERGYCAHLSATFNLNKYNTSRALNFNFNSVRGRKLRAYAVNKLFGHCYLLQKHLI